MRRSLKFQSKNRAAIFFGVTAGAPNENGRARPVGAAPGAASDGDV
jgi:hypothetical protein